MKSSVRTLALTACIAMIGVIVAGCTPQNTIVKKQDSRGAASSKEREIAGYEEDEDVDLGGEDSEGLSGRKGDEKESSDEESYTKGKYYQIGMASWYGREFHGKKTASGEKFDMGQLTAAHRTLPFGTLVKVKNFKNGKTVTVRINDRGPFRGSRIIDLSHAAAKKLDMVRSGEAKVGIQIIRKGGDEDLADKDGDREGIEEVSDRTDDDYEKGHGDFTLQAGAFYSKRNAEKLKARIEDVTGGEVMIVHEQDLYKVRIKGISSRNTAERYKRKLSEEDIPSYILRK